MILPDNNDSQYEICAYNAKNTNAYFRHLFCIVELKASLITVYLVSKIGETR